jgi:hypothetical protein
VGVKCEEKKNKKKKGKENKDTQYLYSMIG